MPRKPQALATARKPDPDLEQRDASLAGTRSGQSSSEQDDVADDSPGDSRTSASVAQLLPARPRKGWLVLLVMASALVCAGVLWSQIQPYRPRVVDVPAEPQPWVTALVLIPNEPPPPPAPAPIDKLEARLAALARRVEAVSANIEPPQVAFDAEALRADLEHTIARLDERAQVSVHVRDLESGHVLFDY
jgi:hypothetical protein